MMNRGVTKIGDTPINLGYKLTINERLPYWHLGSI